MISISTILFVIASMIYILFRPTTLLMFHWFDFVGLHGFIMALRLSFNDAQDWLPHWVIFSLPFSLWVFSYMLLITAVWRESNSIMGYFWLWILPLIAVSSEVLQICGYIPGHFDAIDLLSLVTVLFVGSVFFSCSKRSF